MLIPEALHASGFGVIELTTAVRTAGKPLTGIFASPIAAIAEIGWWDERPAISNLQISKNTNLIGATGRVANPRMIRRNRSAAELGRILGRGSRQPEEGR